MKVYSAPEELKYEPDYTNYDPTAFAEAEDMHREALVAWLREAGYTGKKTGAELQIPHADGYARYMFADARGTGTGLKSCLIHLPYGDAWDSRDVEFLPQKEVLKRIAQTERVNALFARKAAERKAVSASEKMDGVEVVFSEDV